jgi:pyruvate carboxylase subunit A
MGGDNNMFDKILIANRGEIALRILRTCKELGIKTVAVYSDADRKALHVKYADETKYIGKSPPASSYLNIDKLIELATQLGVDGIHPGYGFLAENPEFVRACERASLKFIGPSSTAIEKMGNKVEARKIMRAAGVPVTPGSESAVTTVEDAIGIASEVGYPIIIKASAGGGGMGMRIVSAPDELADAMKAAQYQAQVAFGNPEIFIEKYISNPRHIEFQILADSHGNIVHLGERECSIQRRYQKLVEEAPSTALTQALRDSMGAVAVKVARTINYENAGTVEFIYSDGNFYFNEMNTRLQVEHPVTEMITQVDLVREQIRLAAGETLGYTQSDIKFTGWAIECRINAEDPMNNFFPSPGRIYEYQAPGGFGVRVDAGVYAGFTVPTYYDPLIAKLIVWGRTRRDAIAHIIRALDEYVIKGIKTNIPFHKKILRDPYFQKGMISTHFIEDRKIIQQLSAELARKELAPTPVLEPVLKYRAIISAAIGAYLTGKKPPFEYKPTILPEPAERPKWHREPPINRWALAGRLELMGYYHYDETLFP